MLFRRRATLRTTGPSARPSPYDPFRYNPDNMLSFPSINPAYPGYTTFLTLKQGGTVTVVTPFTSPPDSPRFRLADLPLEEWIALQDAQGRPLPLALYVDTAGVQGRWL